jgi:uncharacterized protein DUF6622
MRPVVEIVTGTPPWVWALLALLLYLGIRALRPTTAPLWRVAILPTVFFVWGLYGLVMSNGLTVQRAAPWLVALAVGTIAGFALAGTRPVRADRSHGLVHVPGGSFTLVLSLLIFAIKYVFAVLHAMDPAAFADARFWLTELAVSGVLTGMFIGRFAGLWRQYRAAPDEDLSGDLAAGRQPA